MANRKTPRSAALYRRIIAAGHRTVRIGAYPKKEGQQTGITLGIGYGNAESFSKIYFEITPEVWSEIDAAVSEAFRVIGEPLKKPRQERKTRQPVPTPEVAPASVANGPSDSAKAQTGRRQRQAPSPLSPNDAANSQ